MQQPHPGKFLSGRRTHLVVLTTVGLCAAAVAALFLGCGPSNTGLPGKEAKPFAGAALRVSCPDREFAAAIAPLARAWAGRTGAGVEVVPDPMAPGDAADIGVIPLPDLGAWAERGELVPVPIA